MTRVLIVDDEPSVREILATFAGQHGYEAAVAEDGQTALDLVPVFRPHIVLLDVAMPGINGLKTLERLLEIAPECCVIMMSGHANHQSALKALENGAIDFIQKPFDFGYLERMLLTTAATRVPRAERAGETG